VIGLVVTGRVVSCLEVTGPEVRGEVVNSNPTVIAPVVTGAGSVGGISVKLAGDGKSLLTIIA